MADLAGDGATEYAARLQAALRDPMFTDLDLPKLQSEDVATNFPGMTEAFLRLYTAYQEEQKSEEHTSELQSLMRISYAVFRLKKKTRRHPKATSRTSNLLHPNIRCTHI